MMVKDTFTKLGIEKNIVKALAEENIITPSDIQIKSIPIILSGKDIIGKSKTGSGKTGAFAIPIINMTKHSNFVKSLILAPTRELAIQISNEFSKFSKYKNLNFATVYGGASINKQIKAIKKADVVIGTPGRIIDHLVNNNLDLSKINNFVLDEADQMVDMGFINDIEKILNFTSDHKQIILFGATISEEVNYLINNYMNKPVIAESETNVSNNFLKQYYYPVKRQNKFSLLTHLLKTKESEQVIVFCSSIVTVKMVHKNLKSNGIDVGMIHGKMNQNKRIKSINQFNNGKQKILVASPVAARGLDIKNVSHIFNYDLSDDPQEYVHRVGRTARGGKKGKAYTLLSRRDRHVFNRILNNYDLEIEKLPLEEFPIISFKTGNKKFSSDSKKFKTGNKKFKTGNKKFKTGNKKFKTGNKKFSSDSKKFKTGNKKFKTGNKKFKN